MMRRGSNVELTREIPGLAGVVLGVRWNAGGEAPLADNLVLATVLCDASQKVLSDEHFVFFNQLSSPDLSVSQLEWALGDDQEQVEVDLNAVPAKVERIVVVLYVNEGAPQRRTLDRLKSCAIRVLNLSNNSELVRSEDLASGLGEAMAMTLGELYRYDGGWRFKVLGGGYADGIKGVAADYGLTL
ncbi:MAG: TerD family protein [Micromonosporaceae bacterium]